MLKSFAVSSPNFHKKALGLCLEPILVTVTFALVFYIELINPMQSDDFAYALKGLSFDEHLAHYLNWSGRFLVDYYSSIILQYGALFKAFVIATLFCSMIFLIAHLPAVLFKVKIHPLSYLFIFAIYWITCPTLGQIVFWIVGACNYLIPSFIAVMFIFFLCNYLNYNNFITLGGVSVLAFPAGLSNENIAAALVLSMIALTAYRIKSAADFKILLPLALLVLGFLILILAPGNFKRAVLVDDVWYHYNIFEKLWFFFRHKFFGVFKYLIWIAVLALILTIAARRIKSDFKPLYQVAMIFFLIAALCVFSMVLSPAFPARAKAGPLVFAITGCSFLLAGIFNHAKRGRRTAVYALLFFCLAVTAFSAYRMLDSRLRLVRQDQIRQIVIQDGLSKNRRDFVIPEFFYEKSFRRGDSIDKYWDAQAAGEYYGVASITQSKVSFDYGYFKDGKRLIVKSSCQYLDSAIIGGRTLILSASRDVGLLGESLSIKFSSGNKTYLKIDQDNLIDLSTSHYQRVLIGFELKKADLSKLDSIRFFGKNSCKLKF